MPRDDVQRTEVHPEVIYLGKLLERVGAGKVRVPQFQRPFVWGHRDMLQLLESVRRGFPIGSILVWETDEKVSSLNNLGPIQVGAPPQGSLAYILDGNQRLSTLVGTLMLSDEPPVAEGVDWRVYYDLETSEFMHEPNGGLKLNHFPVRSLLSTSGFLDACRAISEQERNSKKARKLVETADSLANAIRNYQLPLISVKDADLDSAVAVFSRLNRQGRKMTPDQMVSALTYREGEFHLALNMDELLADLRGFKDLDRVFVLRVVLGAMDLDLYAKDFARLMVEEKIRVKLPQSFEAAATGVRAALDFLGALGATSDRLLPYGLQLVLLADFFRLQPDPTPEIRALLERWFWVTSFTGWFGGVNTARVSLALSEMREVARGERRLFRTVDLTARARPFPLRFDGRSARARAYLLYLTSLRPRSFSGGDELSPGALYTERGSDALGYVVARGLPPDLQHSPANRIFVDLEHRGQALSLLEALPAEDCSEVLLSHGFPPGAGAILQHREELIRARLDYLIDGERQFLADRGVALPEERTSETVRDSDTTDAE